MSVNTIGAIRGTTVIANYNNGYYVTSSTVHGEITYWNFPSPRVRPKPLSTTTATLSIGRQNTNTYKIGSRQGTVLYTCSGYPVSVETVYGGDPRNQVLQKLGEGDLNLGVTIAEFDQTADMIWNRLKSLHNILGALRSKDWKRLRDQFGITITRKGRVAAKGLPPEAVAANLWFEWHFGWEQLYSDIYGGMKALNNGLRTRGSVVRASRGRNPIVRRGQKEVKPLKIANGPRIPQSFATAYGRVRNPTLRTLGELGLLNLPSLAWEKVPFSWVVDSIIPIGPTLAAFTAGAGLYNVTGSVVTETVTNQWYSTPIGKVLKSSDSSILRTPLTGPSSLFVNVNMGSLTRLTNMVALVTQQLSSSDRAAKKFAEHRFGSGASRSRRVEVPTATGY